MSWATRKDGPHDVDLRIAGWNPPGAPHHCVDESTPGSCKRSSNASPHNRRGLGSLNTVRVVKLLDMRFFEIEMMRNANTRTWCIPKKVESLNHPGNPEN